MRLSVMLLPFIFLSWYARGQQSLWVDRPIIWTEQRTQLSLEYLEKRHGIVQSSPAITPRMVVVHWTAIPTLDGSFNAFNPELLPGSRPELQQASALNVSVPYLVDRDGSIFRLMPDTLFGRHCIGLNYMSIGIENVGNGKSHKLTRAQLEANISLIRSLADAYPIEYLIGHHEYGKFRTSELWRETDSSYFTHKVDPGKKFMRKLRRGLKDLDLRAKP
jgi:N-acetylmuramoyl-L-alanine amidase